MWARVVAVVLQVLKLGVEHAGVVNGDCVEEPVELLDVDSMRSLDLAAKARCPGFDVDVVHALVEDVPMEATLEFGAVVRLDGVNREGQFRGDVVDELNRGLLVQGRVDP